MQGRIQKLVWGLYNLWLSEFISILKSFILSEHTDSCITLKSLIQVKWIQLVLHDIFYFLSKMESCSTLKLFMHACEFMYLFDTSYSLHLVNSCISSILHILCILWINVSRWYFIFSASCEFMYLFDTSYSLHVVNLCISSILHILCMLWIHISLRYFIFSASCEFMYLFCT